MNAQFAATRDMEEKSPRVHPRVSQIQMLANLEANSVELMPCLRGRGVIKTFRRSKFMCAFAYFDQRLKSHRCRQPNEISGGGNDCGGGEG